MCLQCCLLVVPTVLTKFPLFVTSNYPSLIRMTFQCWCCRNVDQRIDDIVQSWNTAWCHPCRSAVRSQSCWSSGWGCSGLCTTAMVNPAFDVNLCSWLEVGLSTFPLNSWWRLLGYCWSCVILSILQTYTLFIFNKLVYLLHWWFNWETLILTHSIEVLWLGKINGIFTFIIRGIQYPSSWYYKFILPWWTLLMFSNYKFDYVNKFSTER